MATAPTAALLAAPTYGLLPQGFVRPRLPEIRSEIIADFVARLRAAGFTDAPQTGPDSVLGLLIDTFAERETALWELAEGIYLSLYPSSATGSMLDRAVSFAGVSRLDALKATATVALYAVPGTTVPAGTVVRNSVTQATYTTDRTIVVNGSSFVDATIGVRAVTANTTYSVRFIGYTVQIDSGPSPTVSSILNALASQLQSLFPIYLQVTTGASAMRVLVTFEMSAASIDISTNLVMVTLAAPVPVTAVDAIEEQAAVGDINQIVTMVPGLDRVENLGPGSSGRDAETDSELRSRYSTGVFRLGAGTLESIRANLRANVPGLSFVDVQENTKDVHDEQGRKPHSIHVIVDGGDTLEIGREIFRVKGAGIDTNGSTVAHVIDSQGVEQYMRFDRASAVLIWVRAHVTLLPGSEETFPTNGYAQVAQAIVDAGNSFGIGKDVVWQRLLASAVRISGVASIDLTVAATTIPGFVPDTAMYEAQNVTISPVEVARFDLARVTVD